MRQESYVTASGGMARILALKPPTTLPSLPVPAPAQSQLRILVERIAADGEFWGIPGNERGRIGSFRKFSETSPAYSVVKEHISLRRPERVRV